MIEIELGAVALIYHSEFVKIILSFLVNFSQIGKESSLPTNFLGENRAW